jgi:hypothetical protein
LTTGQVGAKRISAVEVGVGIGVAVKEGVGVGIGIKGTGRAVPNVRIGRGVKVGVGVSGIVSLVGVGIAVKVGDAVGVGSLAAWTGKSGRRGAHLGPVRNIPAQQIPMAINAIKLIIQRGGICSSIVPTFEASS